MREHRRIAQHEKEKDGKNHQSYLHKVEGAIRIHVSAISLAFALFCSLPLLGQYSTVSCSHGETGTCRQAVDCSQANVQAAISASSAGGHGYISPTSFEGDGVYVPGGSCSWSVSVGWSNKNINVIGANPTITQSADAFDVGVTNSGPFAAAFHISGFTFAGNATFDLLNLNASGQGTGSVPTTSAAWAGFFRVDHLNYNYAHSGNVFIFFGPVFGELDHINGTTFQNHFEFANLLDAEYNAMHASNFVQFEGEYGGRILSAAPGSSSPGGLGSQYMVYIEDSTFNCPGNYSGAISDSESGGQRMVFRYNTTSGTCFHFSHWTRGDEWDGDLYEIYNNTYDGGLLGDFPMRFESGTGVIFNNTLTNYSDPTVHLDERRADGQESSAFAYACDGNTSVPAGRPVIDGNAGDPSAHGWPCAGQIGSACLAGGCSRGSGSGGMNSLPLILWNNTGLSGVNVPTADAPYIKTTAHSVAGPLNGAKDYCVSALQPSSCGIYNGIASYLTYPHPYPSSVSGGTVATPTFSPLAGTYASTQNVTISTTTGGASIFYTTDGSTPTPSSTLYTGPVTVSSSLTIKAIATASGLSNSLVGSADYVITTTVPTPTFAPGSGTFVGAQTVTISDTLGGTSIFYTTDGSTPTPSSTFYGGPITVSASETVKAMATAPAHTNSLVGSATYVITAPVCADPTQAGSGSGTYLAPPTVLPININFSSSTPGCAMHYVLGGGAPGCSDTLLPGGGLNVSVTTTVRVIACQTAYTPSGLAGGTWTIVVPAAAPTFAPGAGTYAIAQNVAISSATAGATVCFTNDGSTPTGDGAGNCTHGTQYTTPVNVPVNTTLKAIATKSGNQDSGVATAVYVFSLTPAAPVISSMILQGAIWQ